MVMESTRLDLGHRVNVARLRQLLEDLRGDDVLEPNMVGNLKIVRAGEYVGYVDLLHVDPHVEMFTDDRSV